MSISKAKLNHQQILETPAASTWIQSPSYDAAFFLSAPLLGLVWLLIVPKHPGIILVLALLGIPHYLSTFTFYFWDENRLYQRAHWAAFFAGPLVISVLVVIVASFKLPYILQVTVFFWNVFHVSRQSCGILSIYRHRAGVFDPQQKALANRAILASNACLACWNLASYPNLLRPLSFVTPALPHLLWLGFGALSTVALARLGKALWQRQQRSRGPDLPEMCFLLTSLCLFHPYVWILDGTRATTAMLIGHFIQYLGIVWLLHHRRFTHHDTSRTPYWLARLSTNTILLVAVVLATGCVYLFFKRLFSLLSLQLTFDMLIFMLVFLHFYLDRLFWAFKEPHVRQTIGPYLITGASNIEPD